jgi:arylsulfatase
LANVEIPGTIEVPRGKAVVKSQFTPDPASKTGGGTVELFVNDQPAGSGRLTRTFFRHGLEPFEVGRDSITPIDPAYKEQGDFAFTGEIEQVVFELK